ncbi:MAG: hypothetical protein HC870_01480, partial [Rhizobiales bacterium]|nr:hypothetical protein [Hyphomicrobiales bacterium]
MEYLRLDGDALTLVFALDGGGPKNGAADLAYLGARLPDDEDLAMLAAAAKRGRHESQPDAPPVPGLLPERKGGWSGTPALGIRRGGLAVMTDLRLVTHDIQGGRIVLAYSDDVAGVSVHVQWRIGAGDVVTANLTLMNTGQTPIEVEHLAALALPVPARFTQVTVFSGRWAAEMQEHRRALVPDGLKRDSAIGKPGFRGGNWLIMHAGDEVLGAHLAWSGDQRLALEPDAQGAGDGRAMLLMG